MLPVVFRGATIRGVRVHGVAVLQPKECSSGLHGGVEVGSGQSQMRQTEGVGCIRLLRGDHAAARPLISAVLPGERYGANLSVTVYGRGPHVQPEARVVGASDVNHGL